jgi:hypothetical protein
MDDYTPATYGDRIASVYDERYPDSLGGDPSLRTALLAELAGERAALELGIGTGRVALPLKASGVAVHGIDASTEMIDRLRTKPGGSDIPVTIADFRDFDLGRRFGLIYVVFNTFFGLLTQEDQVTSFHAVARHLDQGGAFLIEAFVPDVTRLTRGQLVSAVRSERDEIELEVTVNDSLAQRNDSHHVIIREDGIQLYPVRIRYAFVSELDLMAQLAGLRLRERWCAWDKSPFDKASTAHISVWEPA